MKPTPTIIKHTFFLILLLVFILPVEANNETAFIPMPNSIVTLKSKPFKIDSNTSIGQSSNDLDPSVKALQTILKDRARTEINVKNTGKNQITLSIDTALKEDEHYRLEITKNNIKITGATPAAVFRGVMTFEQLLLNDPKLTAKGEIPAIIIDDAPRFPYRAIMLDPARNFLSIDDLKFFIDQMAKFKYNVLQLHLTDDQGWRIKISKYPQLSSDLSYSKDEIRDLINYAADRYIEIIPEIDIPGHTSAFLSVFPELGCSHLQDSEIEIGKTVNRMLCASNPEVYNIFEDIITEISSIFPSEYIHLGGDEAAITENWAKCDSCLNYIQQQGYTQPSQLMIPFFNNIFKSVRENGKKAILWCELNNIYPPADKFLFPYPDDITLVSWRAGLTPTCLKLTGINGIPIIMAPGEYAYLDYPQFKGDLPEFNNWGMPVTTLEKSYQFDPGYGLPQEEQKHILGIMATLWGEAIKDINRVTYMAFPRALALAEAGWTQIDNRNWESFTQRLYPILSDLMRDGVSFRVPFEIVTYQ